MGRWPRLTLGNPVTHCDWSAAELHVLEGPMRSRSGCQKRAPAGTSPIGRDLRHSRGLAPDCQEKPLRWHFHRARPGPVPPRRELLGLQGHRLQVCQMSGLCRLRRRSSRQRLAPDFQPCGTAHGRDPRGQPRPSQGLRHRPVLGGRAAALGPVSTTNLNSQPVSSARHIFSGRSPSCE